MNPAIITDHINRRMPELGYGKFYTRMRHFVLAAGEVRETGGGSDWYFLAEPVAMAAINSDNGIFDLSATSVNELQYEHRGTITITNYSAAPNHIRMIQAIPENR